MARAGREVSAGAVAAGRALGAADGAGLAHAALFALFDGGASHPFSVDLPTALGRTDPSPFMWPEVAS